MNTEGFRKTNKQNDITAANAKQRKNTPQQELSTSIKYQGFSFHGVIQDERITPMKLTLCLQTDMEFSTHNGDNDVSNVTV